MKLQQPRVDVSKARLFFMHVTGAVKIAGTFLPRTARALPSAAEMLGKSRKIDGTKLA
jgi:hypothetical protein